MGYVYHTTGASSGLPFLSSLSHDSWVRTLVEVVVFNLVADTWFYFVHRMFHEIEWLYRRSHFLHHSSHPVNTFIGNGGDVLELMTQGEMQVFFPPLFVPIQARSYILNALLMQGYVLFLHNGTRTRFPPAIRKFIVDPYEHNVHHYYGYKNYNFGLYFTLWDRLLGTHKATLPAFEAARLKEKESVIKDRGSGFTPGQKESMKQIKEFKGGKGRPQLSWATTLASSLRQVFLC